jgi:hypothetical protein
MILIYLQKEISQKTWRLEDQRRKEQDPEPEPDPDLHQNITDLEHCRNYSALSHLTNCYKNCFSFNQGGLPSGLADGQADANSTRSGQYDR